MAINNFRLKHFLVELRYPTNYDIARNRVDILQQFPTPQFAINEIAIKGNQFSELSDYNIEMNRAHFNIENVARFENVGKKAADLLNYVIRECKIEALHRVGIRFYIMALDDKERTRLDFARLLTKQINLDAFGKGDYETSGFVTRTKTGAWSLRLGVFSSDRDVMAKYHVHNDDPNFNAPSLVYDLDFYQTNVVTKPAVKKGFRSKEFDMLDWINDSHQTAMSLAEKHVKTLGDIDGK